MTTRRLAEAFSSRSFTEVYDWLADTVQWVVPGQAPIAGKAAVVAACESASAGFARLTGTDVLRFLSVAEERFAAVDAIVRYSSPDGSAAVVSSADIYEFDSDGLLATVTSYAVELDL